MNQDVTMLSTMETGVDISTETLSASNVSGNNPSRVGRDALHLQMRIGRLVFVSIMMLLGVIGNTLVLYLFTFKFPKSNHRIYILCLAVLDMIACSICIPAVIAGTITITCNSAVACTLIEFLFYFNSSGSGLILVVIAVDRYKKICYPLGKQMNERMAKIACSIAIVISVLIAWPAPILYLISIRKNYDDVNRYGLYFYGILLLVVFGSFVTLIVLYSFIGHRLWKQAKARSKLLNPTIQGAASSSGSGTDNSNTVSTGTMGKHASSGAEMTKENTIQMQPLSENNEETTNHPITPKKFQNKVDPKNNTRAKKTRKTTLMLFMITVIFIVSFVPHLALRITAFLNKNFLDHMTFAEALLYHTFVYSFFINNMANPIIYGFCDPRFRREVRKIYIQLICKT